ncbi:ATP-binding protein [Salinisphaera sp. G21_0]|uniref:ATP-binding protein n=1 Tax=Salinisphaera sp. G21_0 TaxID=2821094 RepID=UPI001ADB226A|nr:ATP-binding protein [Salinisphaera sp. G21_0]MBO9483897.1 HAMP domain-containing histidine kinase [Salinisphaera sp. G21_0]
MTTNTTPNLSIGAENLKRLCWLRGTLIAVEGMAFFLASRHFDIQITGLVLACLITLLMIIGTVIRLYVVKRHVSDQEFFVQLLLDLFSQSTLLFFSGGYTNPLVSTYLITVCIGAALLPGKYSWGVTFTATLLYTLLMKWYVPSGPGSMLHLPEQQLMIDIHLLGMWLTFVLSAFLINYFVELMASALRKQQRDIAISRERQLRDESILAIALQAAGAAHELGTPLTTMAIVLRDLQEEYQGSALAERLIFLRDQIDECKKRLQQLVSESQYKGIESIDSQDFLAKVIQKWQLIRPESELHYNAAQWPVSVSIPCDLTLYQAITSLLDNAEDASPGQVSLHVIQNRQNLTLQILDKGTGFPEAQDRPGKSSVPIKEGNSTTLSRTPYSLKEDGLGIGLLLSQASIERLGGLIQMRPLTCGGSLIEVQLPITGQPEQEP